MSIYKKLREATKKIANSKPKPKPKPPKGVMGGEKPFIPSDEDYKKAYSEQPESGSE